VPLRRVAPYHAPQATHFRQALDVPGVSRFMDQLYTAHLPLGLPALYMVCMAESV